MQAFPTSLGHNMLYAFNYGELSSFCERVCVHVCVGVCEFDIQLWSMWIYIRQTEQRDRERQTETDIDRQADREREEREREIVITRINYMEWWQYSNCICLLYNGLGGRCLHCRWQPRSPFICPPFLDHRLPYCLPLRCLYMSGRPQLGIQSLVWS